MSTAAPSPPSSPADSTAATRRPWRENIEALIVAIAVALLFKYFILEISKIPSGSMQPTLMGNPDTGVYDRVLVDKLSMRMRDPERFEIIVFKHPLEQSRIMVKRLVGMPGERLRVFNGDLWTRANESEAWEILRRPDQVQEGAWRTIDLDAPQASNWTQVLGDSNWLMSGRDISAGAAGRMRYRADDNSIRDRYTDGYPDVLRSGVKPQDARMLRGISPVGDLRVSSDVSAEGDLVALVFQLSEGPFAYEFSIPGPAAAADARPSMEVREQGSVVTIVQAEEPFQLRADRGTEVSVWNLDDRLGLRVDDQVLLEVDVAPVSDQRSSIFLELNGGGAELADLMVERDIYYLAPDRRSWQVDIPEDSYVVLGDNTQDSADSRDWRAQVWTLDDADGEAIEIKGNFRDRDENPTRVKGENGEQLTRFRDRWGEKHWFEEGEAQPGLQFHAALVPRSAIQGRAVATFWPLKPWKKLWRLGWLH
ncbi:MAG: signal peptidase I [Planctomycetota bacterium]|jgi:signal peptidase I